MPMRRVLLAIVCGLGLLASAGCSSDSSAQNQHIDIAKVFSVKSTFGPQFKVITTGPTGIDPRLLTAQKLPDGITFDPPDCAKYAAGQTLPPGLEGNMAAVSAEGEGNRFIALAVETSQQVPFDASMTDKCKRVTFSGGSLHGVVDVIDAPHIDGGHTIGTHRVLEATLGDQTRSGELYNYVAYLDNYLVLVAANPLLIPNQPVAPVNVDRACALLSDAVAAVRG
jgi:hypothetical protein